VGVCRPEKGIVGLNRGDEILCSYLRLGWELDRPQRAQERGVGVDLGDEIVAVDPEPFGGERRIKLLPRWPRSDDRPPVGESRG
jgi:hypothetical protein